jgi:hypothetical protein
MTGFGLKDHPHDKPAVEENKQYRKPPNEIFNLPWPAKDPERTRQRGEHQADQSIETDCRLACCGVVITGGQQQ